MVPAEQHSQNELITVSQAVDSFTTIETTAEDAAPACILPPNIPWKRVEIALRLHARQQAAVAELGQHALMDIDLPQLMEEAVTIVAQVLQMKYCGILELLPNGSTLFLQAGIGWQPGLVGAALTGTQPNSLFGYTLSTQQPVTFKDLPIETRFSGPPLLHNHRIVSGVNVVIQRQGQTQPYGILGAYTTETRRFTQYDIHFLQSVANVLATTVSRKQSEERLRLMERAIAASSNGIVLTDAYAPNNPIVYVNSAFQTITGYTAEEVMGQNCRFLQGNDRDQPGLDKLRSAIEEQRECHVILRNYRKDGSLFWNELHISPVFNAEENVTHFVGVQTDISDRIQAEAALKESQQQLDGILKSLEDVVWSTSLIDNKLLYLNPAAEKIYSRPISDFLNDPQLWFKVIHLDDQAHVLQTVQKIYQIGSGEIEYRILRPDGEVRWLHTRSHVTYNDSGEPVRLNGIASDITERKQMQEQLIHDAFHDALTGLPNRVLFMKQLAAAIIRAKASSHLFAVLFLDLDRFKLINDSLGHLVGDQLLVAIAHRLATCLQPNETIARLGGDEFIILIDRMQHPQEATELAERIQKILQVPFHLNEYKVYTTASIGIAMSLANYDQPEQVLRDADIALYHAKGQNRTRHSVFDSAMYDQTVALLQLETDLHWAIEQKQLRVHYQPIVSLETGEISGFEALVRWQHPTRGLVSPAEFIPIAEEVGLIIPIGHWVLQTACQRLRRWQDRFPQAKDLTISVNLSSKQLLQPNLSEQVAQVLQETGLNPACLKLEITESGIMQTTEPIELLSKLKALQVHLSIDDFGTGYSSLSRLRQFPIDTLKIDRSFVSNMHEASENAEIVHAIISLAHNLGLDVVAEGVEIAEQLAWLKALHCEQGQGYFFAKPLDHQAAADLIAASPKW